MAPFFRAPEGLTRRISALHYQTPLDAPENPKTDLHDAFSGQTGARGHRMRLMWTGSKISGGAISYKMQPYLEYFSKDQNLDHVYTIVGFWKKSQLSLDMRLTILAAFEQLQSMHRKPVNRERLQCP